MPGAKSRQIHLVCYCGYGNNFDDTGKEFEANCLKCGRQLHYRPKDRQSKGRPQSAGNPIDEDGKHLPWNWHPKSQPVGYKSRLLEMQESLAA